MDMKKLLLGCFFTLSLMAGTTRVPITNNSKLRVKFALEYTGVNDPKIVEKLNPPALEPTETYYAVPAMLVSSPTGEPDLGALSAVYYDIATEPGEKLVYGPTTSVLNTFIFGKDIKNGLSFESLEGKLILRLIKP